MTILYDPELSETMVFCDNPNDCDISVRIGLGIDFFYLRYMGRQMDFCSPECLFDWIIEQPFGEDYESD